MKDSGVTDTTAKATHTPGPWHYDETTLAICRLIVSIEDVQAFNVFPASDSQRAIAYVPCDFHRDEQESNARLITAAPDLLEAVKGLRAWIIGECGASAYECVECERADAAIAKAEGR